MEINYESILSDFINESLSLLQRAEKSILDLEKEFNEETVHELFRAMHTIKGNAGLIEAPEIRSLAHSMESLLQRVRNGYRPDQNAINLLLEALDLLERMVRGLGSGESVPLTSDIIKNLGEAGEKPSAPEQKTAASHPGKKENKRGAIQIPSAFLSRAKSENRFLSLLRFDYGQQQFSSLADAASKLILFDESEVLMKGPLAPTSPGTLSGFFVLLTEKSPEERVKSSGILFSGVRSIYQPEERKPEINQAPETKENHETKTGQPADTHIHVPFRLIDNLINLAGQTIIARNELLQTAEQSRNRTFLLTSKKVGQLVAQMQENIMRTRMQELNVLFQKLPRTLRNLSASTGKKVEMHVTGESVELDRLLIEGLSESFIHIVRNAVDHGIESPSERKKAGKDETGRIDINARLQGGNVIISIKDDGAGLNFERIKKKALEHGLATAGQIDVYTESELRELIFAPGFSTAEQITSTSGRGVGMDVVRTAIKKMGGSVDIESGSGGTEFIISIPQTVTVTRCLLVRAGDSQYALPQQSTVELVTIDPAFLRKAENHSLYTLRDRLLPVVHLSNFLHTDAPDGGEKYLAVVQSEKHIFGIAVHDVLNPEEIVLRPLGEEFSNLEIFSGATILGNGDAVLILDVSGIARSASIQPNFELRRQTRKADILNYTDNIIYEVSGTLFASPIRTGPRITRIKKSELFHFNSADSFVYNGLSLPVIRLENLYDLPPIEQEEIFLIIFKGDFPFALAASKILSISPLSDIEKTGKETAERNILDGRTVISLDPYRLKGPEREEVSRAAS